MILQCYCERQSINGSIWNKYKRRERIIILIKWIRPSRERGRPNHLSKSCFIVCTRGSKLSLYRSVSWEIFMPSYEKPAGEQRNGHEMFWSRVHGLWSAMASLLEINFITRKRAIIVYQFNYALNQLSWGIHINQDVRSILWNFMLAII